MFSWPSLVSGLGLRLFTNDANVGLATVLVPSVIVLPRRPSNQVTVKARQVPGKA